MAEGPLARLITRFLKVPPEPEPPLGSPGSVRVFNAAPGYYQYRLVVWGIRQAGALIGLIIGLAFVAGGIEVVELPLLLTHLSRAERRKHVETALAVVLVTGAARGFGRATAEHFLARGARVAVHVRTPERARAEPRLFRAVHRRGRGHPGAHRQLDLDHPDGDVVEAVLLADGCRQRERTALPDLDRRRSCHSEIQYI